MEANLKIAIANLKSLKKRDARLGNREQTLRFFQKIQRIIAGVHNISCVVDSRETWINLSMYYYRKDDRYPTETFFEQLNFPEVITAYQWKKLVFDSLSSFIANVEHYEQSE